MRLNYQEMAVKHAVLMKIGELTLPRKVSVAVARNLILFEKEFKLMDDQKKDIADRYADKDKNGNFIVTENQYTFKTDADKEDFTREIKELNDVEIDLDIMTFEADELEKCEKIDRYDILTPVQEASIGWMISY